MEYTHLSRCRQVLAGFAFGLYLLGWPVATIGSDHRDSSVTQANPSADIGDLFTFMNPDDTDELVMIMTIVADAPTAQNFLAGISYNFLIENSSNQNFRVSCEFPTSTAVSCNFGDLSVAGAVGTTAAIQGLRVFSAIRDDPFYVNASGLGLTLSSCTLRFEETVHTGSGSANFFAGSNVMALVIGIDRDFLTANQSAPVLKLWATTEQLP